MKKLLAVTALALLLTPVGLHSWANFASWNTSSVLFYVNPSNTDGLSSGAITTALQNASSAWSTQSAANFRFNYAGTSGISSAVNDGVNVVMFRPDANGGVAATTYSFWDNSGRLLNADIVVWENDFQFFTEATACTGGLYLEDVTTHEFGHALGLSHSGVSTATMYPYISGYCATDWDSLDPDDIAGVETLYPPISGGSGGGSGGGTGGTGGTGGGTTTPDSNAPAPPTSLTVAVNSSSPTSSLTLSWVSSTVNSVGINVERSLAGGSFSQIANLPASATSYTDNGLASGTTYSYRVYQYNNNAVSPYSNTASGQTQSVSTTTPTTPTSPAPSKPGNGKGPVKKK